MRFSKLLTTLTLMSFAISFGIDRASGDDKYGKKSSNSYGKNDGNNRGNDNKGSNNYNNTRKGFGVTGNNNRNDYNKNNSNNYQNNDRNDYRNNNNRNDYRRDSGRDYRDNDNNRRNNNSNWNRDDWYKFQSKYRHFDKNQNKYFYNKKHDHDNKHWWSNNHGYRFDNHVVHDRHGHSIGRYAHVTIKPTWGWIVPHVSAQYHGTYYYNDGGYYYYPQTYSDSASVYASVEPQPMQFGGYAYTADLADRLETTTNQMCLDMYYNYRHNPGFSEIYREAYQLLQLAKYIQGQATEGDRQAMAEQVGGMDALTHYLAESTEPWTRAATRPVGDSELGSKLEIVDSTLHHLMYDMGVPLTESFDQGSDDIAPGRIDEAPAPGDF